MEDTKYKLILVNDRNVGQQDILDLLSSFEQDIFIPAFPNDDEREDFKSIIERAGSTHALPASFIALALDENGNLIGGSVFDWYASCKSLELIYIAISPNFRGKGLGTFLFNESIRVTKDYICHCYGIRVAHVFFESENPIASKGLACSMDPVMRLRVYSHWGAKRIPVNYVQPPLSDDSDYACNLFLFVVPESPEDTSIPKDELISFLKDFYTGLDQEPSNVYLNGMIHQITEFDGIESGFIPYADIVETTLFNIYDTSVAFHFECKDTNVNSVWDNDEEFDLTFNSYECDLMNYNNQRKRPVRTHHICTLKDIEIILPTFYSYSSEGYKYYKVSKERRLFVDISINYSFAKDSHIRIAHLIIKPSSDNYFTELDLIKLITAFGSKQEEYNALSPIMVLNGDEPVPLVELLKLNLNNECDYSIIDIGITQIELSSIERSDGKEIPGEAIVHKFSQENEIPVAGDDEEELCSAICGFILGIFDYGRMNSAEIGDTINPIVKDEDNSFIVLCRGHLCKFKYENDEERNETIFISPYLLIPSTVLSINEMIMRKLEYSINVGCGLKSNDSKLASIITQSREMLSNQILDDVFQYKSECIIVANANAQRAFDSRIQDLDQMINFLDVRVNNYDEKVSAITEYIENFILGIVAVVQLLEITLVGSTVFGILITSVCVYMLIKKIIK